MVRREKKITFVLLILLFKNISAQTAVNKDWFWQYPKPQGNSLWDVAVIDSSTTIAVGNVGTIIKTTDGGKTWNVRHHMFGTSRAFTDVYFLDKSRGWTTDLETLYQTTDGGENWDTIATNTKYGVGGIDFINADSGWDSWGVPAYPNFNEGNNEKMWGDTLLWSSQKFHHWYKNSGNNVLNHQDINVQSATPNWISTFKTANNATVQALLIDGGGAGTTGNPGVVQIADPWLIDYNDGYGPMNRGTMCLH